MGLKPALLEVSLGQRCALLAQLPLMWKGLKKNPPFSPWLYWTETIILFSWLLRYNITKLCPRCCWDGEGRNWQFSLECPWGCCFLAGLLDASVFFC